MDPRIKTLAKNLVNYSCRVQKEEKVLVESVGNSAIPLVRAVINEVYKAGGLPFTDLKDYSVMREILKEATVEQLKSMAKYELTRMTHIAAFSGLRASDNI